MKKKIIVAGIEMDFPIFEEGEAHEVHICLGSMWQEPEIFSSKEFAEWYLATYLKHCSEAKGYVAILP